MANMRGENAYATPCPLRVCSVALLILLPASARARVVAADLGASVGDGPVRRAAAIGPEKLQLFQLLLVLTLDVAGHVLHGALRGTALLFFGRLRLFDALPLLGGIVLLFVLA